jgi:prefoldin subunit 5
LEQLRAQVAKAPQSLDEQINYFQRKQQLVSRLNSLNSSILTLEKHGEEVRKEAEEDVFSSEVLRPSPVIKKGLFKRGGSF